MTCLDCRHWKRIEGKFGRCRRHPPVLIPPVIIPVVTDKWEWPKTENYDCCGEFAKRDQQ